MFSYLQYAFLHNIDFFACLYIWIVYSHIHINNSFFFTWVTICYTILCHQGLFMLTDILLVHSSQLIIVSPQINILHIHGDGYSGGCPYFTIRGTLLWIFCDKLPCTHMCKFLQGMCLIGKLLHPKVHAFRLVLCTIELIFGSHRREEMTYVSFISYITLPTVIFLPPPCALWRLNHFLWLS